MAKRTDRPQPARKESAMVAAVHGGITEAETATNRAGVSEDIDNQVIIEMNSQG